MDARRKIIYKLLIIIGLLLLLVIFTLQNTQQVDIKLFFWTIHMSTALVILLSLATGILIGWLGIPFLSKKKKKYFRKRGEVM